MGLLLRLKHKMIAGIFILWLNMISISNVYGVVTWICNDEEEDVDFYIFGVLQYSGNYYDEIDIVSLELIDSNVILTLQAPPINDYNHTYSIAIYWNNYYGQNGLNITVGDFGSLTNQVETILQNSTGQEIASAVEVNTIITRSNQIIIPIPIFEQIPEPGNPDFIEVGTGNEIGNNQWYSDSANKTDFTAIYDPESKIISTVSFSAIVIIGFIYLIRKKKK